ncbi:ATP-binding protein [Bacillus atrophaeus]|uniref:ATP-binding protein n=1 Tax=Bacillus atrophaeus TaxID=1452 RepID=UPI00077AB489|nr:ATP-binding protein [Bacillus atrophaeus]KXZ15762.1 hypothetical protein AXI57_06070 [Bacillus atrophaeus]MED4806697.1 ATP-binding protein [Bacillus atrophaeus]GED03689.1 DNA replication protein DnaC [Bacillus atrophaeus]
MIKTQHPKQTNTRAFSNALPKRLQHLAPEKIGVRQCETCGNEVPVYMQNGKKHSRCIKCDNLALEKEMIAFQEETAADAFFWNNSLVPPDTQKATFGNFNVIGLTESQIDAFNKLKWYAEKFGNWGGFDSLLLQGSYGIGKSHLSHSVAQHVKSLRKNVIFANTKMLLRKIRNSYGNSKETEEHILKSIESCDFLVLDDLGAEYVRKDSDGKESWATDLILTIIESRQDKPNIITTNYNVEALQQKYGVHGGRIISRMMQGTKVVKFTGEDRRIKGGGNDAW